ncbi:hypothetical protein FOZ63_031186 [Perkinsus olseni]|uniref:Uncharacterized protein n=1 Tax=Perkinsus olseni TaxID=32597 RepID=A0A7J6QMI3_PEROL|nr:hypothetical protein FOZ63_031186 [Perkinsus olseni]
MVKLASGMSSQSGKAYYGKEEVDDLIDLMECEMESLECDVEYWKTLFNQSQDELNYHKTLVDNLEQEVRKIKADTSASPDDDQPPSLQNSSADCSSVASSCSSGSALSPTLNGSSRTVFSHSATSSRPVSLRSSPSTSPERRRQRAARNKSIRLIRLGRKKSATQKSVDKGGNSSQGNFLTGAFGLLKRIAGHTSSEKSPAIAAAAEDLHSPPTICYTFNKSVMFFIHRVANAVTMMYNESDELTVCHFIRPKERAKILEGLADQGDQAEADDVQEASEQAPEQREVLVTGEGRVLPSSPSPVSVGGGVVQPSSPAHDEDAQQTLSPMATVTGRSPAALEERGSPSRPA